MSGASECFSIGSIVACKTCFNETVEGEVLAFDPNTKMLILKCRSKTAEKLSDVSIMNLQYCSDVQVLKEASGVTETPQPLNLHRLKTRLRNSVDQRHRWILSRNAGVSIEGQNLFMAIGKTLENVAWDGHNIIVFNEVTITPPYKKENVSTDDPNKINAVNYVKKLIDQNNKVSQGNNATDSSLSLSSSSSFSGSSTSNAITSSSTNVGKSSSPVPTH
ncbi:LSM12 homolog A [Condylostylus longicornis]|uniref:LSM12 homolog A n=1 Tax=Condylostylus longicornis TaxID=2530218 RepID=UPI00244E0CE7|nr:LSM12 homolog A [Condylostylus longicornis]